MNYKIFATNALLVFAAQTHAAVQLDATAFTLVGSSDYWPEQRLTLLSDVGGKSVISLDAMQERLNNVGGLGVISDGGGYENQLSLSVRSGYTITGYQLTGTMTGQLDPLIDPGFGYQLVRSGTANNGHYVSLSLSSGGEWLGGKSINHKDLNGSQSFSLESVETRLAGNLSFSIYGSVDVESQWSEWISPFSGTLHIEKSLAQAGLRDVHLTVLYAQAVPEPETYALMLAGLAAVGAVARRRKQA